MNIPQKFNFDKFDIQRLLGMPSKKIDQFADKKNNYFFTYHNKRLFIMQFVREQSALILPTFIR